MFWFKGFLAKSGSDSDVLESEVAKTEKLQQQAKKDEDIQIAEVKSLRSIYKSIQDLLEKGEKDTMNLLASIENNAFSIELAGKISVDFLTLSHKEHIFLGDADFVVDTCKLAISTNKELRSRIISSELLKYDVENTGKESEELKTLNDAEIKILNDTNDLIACIKGIMKFSKTFGRLDNNLDSPEAIEEFKKEIKKRRAEFSRMNTNILKAQRDLDEIEAVLRNMVGIIKDVDARLQLSFSHISKRIIEGKQYSPSNPSGR